MNENCLDLNPYSELDDADSFKFALSPDEIAYGQELSRRLLREERGLTQADYQGLDDKDVWFFYGYPEADSYESTIRADALFIRAVSRPREPSPEYDRMWAEARAMPD